MCSRYLQKDQGEEDPYFVVEVNEVARMEGSGGQGGILFERDRRGVLLEDLLTEMD